MKLLILDSTDPYRNLAVEEYLFRNTLDDIFMLWQNEPTVVIGKSQNAHTEIDLDLARARGVHVARRITGGGAVYHDLGNVNYSILSPSKGKDGLDFAYFTAPIIAALASLGVHAELSGRNDLTVDGKKVSGSAQHAEGDRVLHHGTLLFDSDLAALSAVLRVDEEKLRARAIRSVRSRVTNLRPYLNTDCDAKEFIERIANFMTQVYGAMRISAPENVEIERLFARNQSKEWCYPARELLSCYSIVKKQRYSFGTVEISLDMQGDTVRDVRIGGDFFGVLPIAELEKMIVGIDRAGIADRLSDVDVGNYIHGMTPQMLAEQILS